jgi:two-component system sensor histidine kinase VicK
LTTPPPLNPSATVHERTEVLHGSQNVLNAILLFLSNVQETIDSCADYSGPSVAIEAYKNVLSGLKSMGIKLRYVTEITKDNMHYCKELSKYSYEIRHLDGIKANFSVSETEYVSTATLQEAKPVPQLIYSNVKDIIQQQRYVFESFWRKAIPAEQRIREIEEEEGAEEQEFFEVINDSEKASKTLVDLSKSIKNEALLFLPNDKAMLRIYKIGFVDYLIKASQEKHATIRIICPLSEGNSAVVKRISEEASSGIRILNGSGNSPFGMLIVDSKKCFRAEIKEPNAESLSEAIGFCFYSNRKDTIDSFKSVFELLWNERILNEELKIHNKLQNEFINIAAHELRTPAQSILGYAELTKLDPIYRQLDKQGFIDTIYRNAVRLNSLITDILDVTRIESNTLTITKEQFNLADIISASIQAVKDQVMHYKGTKILFESSKADIFIYADKLRIYQVISNLLSNAIKFTAEHDTITITSTIRKNKQNKNNNDNQGREVVVSIKDTGTGIAPEILPKLFSKFATKSQSGTGLGLFISKNIVEAHGGKIWAHNNAEKNGDIGEGATFAFSLPLAAAAANVK